jgi:hypothetical protein
MTERRERLGKTARHVSEAADLRVRGGLGGRKDDLHGPPDVNEM